MAAKKLPHPLVILAGGKGERAGGPKGLIEYNGRPWLEIQLREYRDRGGDRVVVVLGHAYEDYLKLVPSLSSADVVINPDPDRGQFSSLQLGLAEAIDAAYVLPIDVPVPDEDVWRRLAAELRDPALVCVPTWQDRGGHPVLMSRPFIAKVLSASPLDRLDQHIRQLDADQVKRIAVDDMRVCMNMNTLDQWKGVIA